MSLKSGFTQSLASWAQGYGTANVHAKLNKTDSPYMYSVADYLALSKIKSAIGLDQCESFYFGAAPLKKTTSDFFTSLDMPLMNLYGMSETTGAHVVHSD